ncbi:50S ribosomal protein L5 [Candidatus Dependentiae bacterium]|nr:50S ribosomal protein L5 [Candidatus Dependentiae bacterium]
MKARLYELYKKEVLSKLMSELKLKNIMEVPKLKKIVINMGVGEAIQDIKQLDKAMKELAVITGQKPLRIRAKKSEAVFKLRKGMPIACKVTMTGARMYEFLDRFINAAVPRIRDFKGLSADSFDGRGNYNIGLNEQMIFPEIDFDKVDKVRGMDINIVTSAKNDEHCKKLLEYLGVPFKK